MSRRQFDQKLSQLQDGELRMGSLVDKALYQALDALKRRDYRLAHYVIKHDKEINQQRFQMEEQALALIATEQPVVAHDLRMVAAVLNIVGELERMGDHAKGIATISELMLDEEPPAKLLIQLSRMALKGGEMLNATLEAVVGQDPQAALQIAKTDDELDLLYDEIYHELVQLMLQDPISINCATYLLWAAHNLERFGDHITNICERIIFVATGEMVEINSSQAAISVDRLVASACHELEG